MSKKRILLVNEASFLNTGFSTYGHEVFKRLYETEKFELAELGTYGSDNDPRVSTLPWHFFGNMPKNEEENRIYNTDIQNQFGKWKFEQIALQFQPNIVLNYTDFWMGSYICLSAYRNFYKFIWMPTIDSVPQADEWLQAYATLDGCASYTDWGIEVLRKDGHPDTKIIGSFPPGIETDIFKPAQDKEGLRRSFGIKNDLFIIGTVMRNQKRKLYPDLIESFSKYLQACKELGRQDLVDKTFLYIHTSYPDMGWDLCSLIQEHGVGAKTLFTYTCTNCKFVFPSFFLDSQAICPRCKHNTVHMPNVNNGVDRETLAKVMNIFDVYVQYSLAEGAGMPAIEAAACGIPVMEVDYSAMCDIVRKLNGWPIPVQRYFKESETGCMRALPDNEAFVQMLYQFFNLAPEERAKMGLASRAGALEHYTYDKTAKKWEEYFDNLEVISPEKGWNSPRRNFTPNLNVPPGLNNPQFVQWCVANIWGLQDKVYTHLTLELIKNLNYGTWVNGFNKGQPFNRQTVVDYCLSLNQALNHWENLRCSTKNKRDLEYIYG